MKKKIENFQKYLERADQFKAYLEKAQTQIENPNADITGIRDFLKTDVTKMTEDEIVKLTADIAAIADPTGIAGTISAYSYGLCSKIK